MPLSCFAYTSSRNAAFDMCRRLPLQQHRAATAQQPSAAADALDAVTDACCLFIVLLQTVNSKIQQYMLHAAETIHAAVKLPQLSAHAAIGGSANMA